LFWFGRERICLSVEWSPIRTNDVSFFFHEVECGEVGKPICVPLGVRVAVSDVYPRDKVKIEFDWVKRVGVIVV